MTKRMQRTVLQIIYNKMDQRICVGSIRYYCTAGNGMESFLTEEVKKKLAAENVCHIPGKVLFSSSSTISQINGLKAAERLFLLLKQDSPLRLSAYTNPAKAASMLQSKLLADKNQWISAVMTWSHLQGELSANRNAMQTPHTAQGEETEREERKGREEQSGQGETCFAECRKHRCTRRDERKNNRLRSSEVNEMQTPVKKRKTDEGRTDVGKEETPELGRRREDEAAVAFEFSSRSDSDDTTEGLEHSVEVSSKVLDELGKSQASGNVENVSFRISCKCNGSLSRCLSAQEVNKVMGAGVSKLLGWKVDLKNPQLEVNVYLSDDYCLLGIPLTRLPLANRSYMKTTGLRSTVAWAMASLAEIQPGSCVVDPMCGVGTILIEAAQEHKAACFLGVDIDDGQLERAKENIAYAKLGTRIHLLKTSTMTLPLPSASVDALICDLPFGRKFSTTTNMAAHLPLILREMERVLRFGGIMVVLLNPQLSCLLKKLLVEKQTGRISNQEAKFVPAMQNCPLSECSAEHPTVQTHPGVRSSQTQEAELEQSLLPPLSSLKHQTTFRVSLGAIDGLIHKYVKTNS